MGTHSPKSLNTDAHWCFERALPLAVGAASRFQEFTGWDPRRPLCKAARQEIKGPLP